MINFWSDVMRYSFSQRSSDSLPGPIQASSSVKVSCPGTKGTVDVQQDPFVNEMKVNALSGTKPMEWLVGLEAEYAPNA